MDVYAILLSKLSSIECFYELSAGTFVEIKRKIEAGEEPYEPPYFDPENDTDTEPPFLEEWSDADEFQNIVGQAAVSLVHSVLKDFLDGFLTRDGQYETAEKYFSARRNQIKNESWFHRYLAFFAEAYGVNWENCPVSPEALEEINLARNDMQRQKFPAGIFASELEKNHPDWSSG